MVKQTAMQAQRSVAKRDRCPPAILVYGADTSQVAEYRSSLAAAVIGPSGRAEMRLTELSAEGASIGADTLEVATKSVALFPGQRAVCISGATDTLVNALKTNLAQRSEGDAVLILSAGILRVKSRLRKFFEDHPTACAVALYPDPVGTEEILRRLAAGGITAPPPDAVADLATLAKSLEPMTCARLIELLCLYKLNDPAPLSTADIEAIAPASTEESIDNLLDIVASRRAGEVSQAFRRLAGRAPVTICISAQRFFANILRIASHPSGPQAGIATLRPPAFGRRRERLLRHARSWGVTGAHKALDRLLETDRHLRMNRPAPPDAILERALLAIAMTK